MKKLNMKLLVLSFLLYSCAVNATRVTNTTSCETKIIGRVHGRGYWVGPPPPILFIRWQSQPIYGDIVYIDENFVTMNSRRYGLFNSPIDSYHRNQIITLIDENGVPVIGDIPKSANLTWSIVLILEPFANGDKKVRVVLDANEPFSYCLDPGKYEITGVEFWRGPMYSDITFSRPLLVLEVQPNCVNYIGDLLFDLPSSDAITFLCREGNRPKDAVASHFGLIGGIALEISKAGTEIKHTIQIADSSNLVKDINARTALIKVLK